MSKEQLKVNLILRDIENGEITLREVALGYQPIVIIEPVEDGDDVSFSIDSTGLDQEELAEVLDLLVGVLRNGEEENDGAEGTDQAS